MSTDLDKILNKRVVGRHSYFQLKHFVIGNEPTIQAMLWRCLQELKTRKKSIEAIKMEIEECEDNKELAKLQLEKLTDSAEDLILKRKLSRRVKSMENTMLELKDSLIDKEEESRFFIESFKSLEQKEPLKDFDDLEAQIDYWDTKLSQEVKLKLLLNQPLDSELVKCVAALPDSTQVKQKLLLNTEKVKQLNGESNIKP